MSYGLSRKWGMNALLEPKLWIQQKPWFLCYLDHITSLINSLVIHIVYVWLHWMRWCAKLGILISVVVIETLITKTLVCLRETPSLWGMKHGWSPLMLVILANLFYLQGHYCMPLSWYFDKVNLRVGNRSCWNVIQLSHVLWLVHSEHCH